ncbi:MAG: hypothetical protein M1821_005177 [Bathelium mastoideum]|nr:MAG: hypothetical protein M1821_005177 [Bathelium mastoideum]KAI9677830.1 MAG: hypothetical protein M1822_008142 [Bathelium mastoideum]
MPSRRSAQLCSLRQNLFPRWRRRSTSDDVFLGAKSAHLRNLVQLATASLAFPYPPPTPPLVGGPTASECRPSVCSSGLDSPQAPAGCRRLQGLSSAKVKGAGHHIISPVLQLLTACVQCDGIRPACTACQQRGIPCHYDVEPEQSRMMALKRRNEELEKELSQLWELYAFLQTRPLPEAHQILNRMRSSADLLAVLQFVKDGDLLIQMASTSQSDPAISPLPDPSHPTHTTHPQ